MSNCETQPSSTVAGFFHSFFCAQKAIEKKKLNASDLNEDLLGTDKEKKPP